MRERWVIVVIAVAAGIAAALLYVSSATPVYQAQADLLISPTSDPNLSALSVIKASSDSSNDTQTAALLVDTPGVAQEAARLLKEPQQAQSILEHVQAIPVAGSDVLAVTASASTPAGAARLANAFAQAAIDVRSRVMQAQLRTAIPRIQAEINHSSQLKSATATATDSLPGELSALLALKGAPDPTIQLGTPASAPRGPVSPRTALSLIAGAILGLVFGIATALAADALDPRLRREMQLSQVLDLPVLARVPSLASGGRQRSADDARRRASVLTAHEFLAEALSGSDGTGAENKRTIVFTAAQRDASCTTIALRHARLVAAAGERVILVDGDPRDPAVGPAAGAQPSPEVEHVLAGSRPIEQALVRVAAWGDLRVLAVHVRLDHSVGVRMPMGRDMVAELLRHADVLVVDAPPLTHSARALVLARSADRVVVVAQLGATRLAELRELGELFTGHDVLGAGIVLVGRRPGSDGRGRQLGRKWRRALARLRTRAGSGNDGSRGRGAAETRPVRPRAPGARAQRVDGSRTRSAPPEP